MLAILILAAGQSRRMGRPKQLLPIHGKPMLRRICQEAILAKLGPVTCVLGAFYPQILASIADLPLQIAENQDWKAGMSTSIKKGMESILQTYPEQVEAVLILVGDQPELRAQSLQALFQIYQEEKTSIVASQYGETLGVPALFEKALFPQLLSLEGAAGARKIIRNNLSCLSPYIFPQGAHDLDTPEDYQNFIGQG